MKRPLNGTDATRPFAVALAVTAALAASSCTDHPPGPTTERQAALGGDVAARVGTDVIPVALVAKVAAAQRIPPGEALRRLVDDAICANAARARGLDRSPSPSWRLTAVRGRFTADRVMLDARKSGPPTDEEIKELTSRHWREVDRPETVRVVHAVVQRPKPPDAAAEKRARAIAAAIREATKDAKDGDDFQQRANAVPHDGASVVAQPLPPFEPEGYMTEGPGGALDPDFAKGAFKLAKPGETSDIVETSSGWHVIRLVERIPEQRMSLEARRAAFTEGAYMERARVATQARVKALAAASPIAVSASAEHLMRTLSTSAIASERDRNERGRGSTP